MCAKTVLKGDIEVYDVTSIKSRADIFCEEVKQHYVFMDGDFLFHPESHGYRVIQLKFGKSSFCNYMPCIIYNLQLLKWLYIDTYLIDNVM